MKKLLLIFLLFFSVNSYAETYWVDDDGAANWTTLPNCQGATPLSGTDACSLADANANAQAGDIVYLRSGTYSVGIVPSYSGQAGKVILFEAYNGETVTIQDVPAINIEDQDYIKVDGIDGLDAGTGYYNMIQIQYGSSYNEITNGHFRRTGEPYTEGYAIVALRYQSAVDSEWCVHNWLHDNEMNASGTLVWDTGPDPDECNDGGRLITIGSNADADSNYNTFEDSVFYHGGHHIIEVKSSYNVVRNNTVHSECWMDNFADMPNQLYTDCSAATHEGCTECGDTDDRYQSYGGRGIFFSLATGLGGLLEGNRVGHAGRPPDDGGANNIVLKMPNVIARYNYSFGANSIGIYMRDSVDNNAIYNNTVYYNGQIDNTTPFGFAAFAGFSLASSGATGNHVINNIVYDNQDDWDGIYATRWTGTTLRGNHCTADESDFCDSYGDPKFGNTLLSWWNDPSYTATRPDLTLQSDSPCIDTGSYLTKSTNSGSSSTSLTVTTGTGLMFQDGSWGSSLSTIAADYIAIGTVGNTVQIDSISGDTITLASAKTWSSADDIWLYKKSDGEVVLYGDAPDVGAYEASSPPTTLIATVQGLEISGLEINTINIIGNNILWSTGGDTILWSTGGDTVIWD